MKFKIKTAKFFEGLSPKDLIFLLIFPLLTILIMFLPDSLRTELMLNLKNPQWWQFFTSAFIHQGWNHLIKNLIWYFLFVFPLFFIVATRTEKKKYYFRFLIFIILTFPLVESIFQFNVYLKIFHADEKFLACL